MIKYFVFIGMILLLILSLFSIFLLNDYSTSFFLLLINFLLTIFLVNLNNLNRNLINIQSIFLLGFFIFFLGRIVAYFFDNTIYNDIFCLNFIFSYCESESGILKLIFLLNIILISYSASFLKINTTLASSKLVLNSKVLSQKKILVLCLLCFFGALINLKSIIDGVILAISGGYMALYENQAEKYQTPFVLLIGSVSMAAMAVLFSIKNQIKPFIFYFLFFIFLISMFLGILTGSRSTFISGLILMVWYFFRNKKIRLMGYLFFPVFCFGIIYFINKVASLSGARDLDGSETSIFTVIANTLFGQGVTLMVFNTSTIVEGYPALGLLKTMFPGVQVLFGFFGVDNRYEFDWSSYMAYKENKAAYNEGFGLGWSIFSDLYILSFGFIPLFCFLVFIFGKFTIYISSSNSQFKEGLLFIGISSFFSLAIAFNKFG